jgi:hypothetical protein
MHKHWNLCLDIVSDFDIRISDLNLTKDPLIGRPAFDYGVTMAQCYCLFSRSLLSYRDKEGSLGFFLNRKPSLRKERPSSIQRGFFKERIMKKESELVLKVTKEIVVKFIEMGQLSVTSFEKAFKEVHAIVSEALKGTSETGKHED